MKLYSVFFAVGTAHLPGKEGLIALLQEHGYKVSPVKAPKTGQYKDYELKRTQIEWRAYSDSKTGYRFELPVYASPLKIPNTTIVMYMINDMSTGINYSTLGRILAQEEILENENRTLQVFCEKYVTSIGLPLLESRSINEHGCLGVEMVIGSPNPRLKVKILMREHKYIYVIGVDGENMNLLDKNDIEHFFDSFELTRVQADDWNMFKSETGAFSARFPVTPNKSEYAVPGNEGNTITTNIFLANDTSGVTYMVNYFDMDIEDSSISDSAYLTNVITNAMVKMGSGDPEVSLGYKQTYPCASATSHFNGQTLRVSIYLKGKRTYMVMVQMPEGASTKGSEIFFVSFTFLE